MKNKTLALKQKARKTSVTLRTTGENFEDLLSAYKAAPMDFGQSEYFALKKMLEAAQTEEHFFIVWIESKGLFKEIAEQAYIHLCSENYRPS